MKYSKQRELVYEYVNSVKSHPTAQNVYENIRQKSPNISLGTVYRNLENLSNQGKIKRIKSIDKNDRFDADITEHYHARCEKCGKIYDIYMDSVLEYLNKDVEKILNCEVTSKDIIFNIICQDCK